MGDHCSVVHKKCQGIGDEATVTNILNQALAEVAFVGYKETDNYPLSELKPSRGEKAREDQLFWSLSIMEYKGNTMLFPITSIDVRKTLHIPTGKWKAGDRCRALRRGPNVEEVLRGEDIGKHLGEAQIHDVVPLQHMSNSAIYIKFDDREEVESEYVLQDQILPSLIKDDKEEETKEITGPQTWKVGQKCRVQHEGREREGTIAKILTDPKEFDMKWPNYKAECKMYALVKIIGGDSSRNPHARLDQLKPSKGREASIKQFYETVSRGITEIKGKKSC